MRASNSKPLTSMTTITGVLLCLTLLTGAILSAPKVAADASSVKILKSMFLRLARLLQLIQY